MGLLGSHALRIIAIGLALASGCSSCRRSDHSAATNNDHRWTWIMGPVGWLASPDRVLVIRVDRSSGPSGDRVLCDSSGLYEAPAAGGGAARPRTIGVPGLCDELGGSMRYELAPNGQALLYANRELIQTLDLADMAVDTIVRECIPFLSSPAWSTDGRSIAFGSACPDADDQSVLHVARAGGSMIRPIGAVQRDVREDWPTWAPSGLQIAVVRTHLRVPDSIQVVDLATHRHRAVALGSSPAWSPAGDWIAYTREDPGPPIRFSLRLVRPDGTEDHDLVRPGAGLPPADSANDHGVVGQKVWSPGGTELAFGRGSSVWLVRTDGSGLRAIMRGAQ